MRSRRSVTLHADRHAFAQLELCDRFLRLGDDRLLASDQFHFLGKSGRDLLLVLRSPSPTPMLSVIFSIFGTANCVGVAELFGHRLDDQRRHSAASGAECIYQPSIFSPDLTATRTFLPSLVSNANAASACRLGVGHGRPSRCAAALQSGR
jgi:hypothetical protein